MRFLSLVFVSLIFTCTSLAVAEDILIADFEGETYGPGWTVEGTAFGTGPAKGGFSGQMPVTGFLGRGLVNSFLGGDDPTGKLTSPSFKIEQPFISFLVGGGGHDGLAINLLVDGQVVRTAAGPNKIPGGTEALDWHDWDVSEFQGKDAVIEIVDSIGDSWGHINVDQIIQTEKKHAPMLKTHDFQPTKEFLHIPITMNAPLTWIRVEVDGQWVQEFDCPLTVSGRPDFFATLQVGQWKGQKVTLLAEKVPAESQGLELIVQSDKMSQEDTVYREKYRPQFHYTTRVGWINDPNGLLYYKGTWHLFNQHNPFSTNWGNMTWGHATSPDLIHWTNLPDAIQPDKLGTIFSGSGVVDKNNTSGFQDGKESPLVLIFTYNGESARFGAKASQGIAYSTDGGKTFTKYDKNPVLPHIIGGNRDPKVIWFEPTKRWIMALYMDAEDYSLFESEDLKSWVKLCDINNLGCSECPDFFPLPVDGDASNVKWVFWGANGKYLIGSFDGKEFKPETPTLTNKYGGNDYAAMTFSDAPDGRRIQLSWMQGGEYPRMPFNQQYTVPRHLTLRTTPQGIRLFMNPVKELESLRAWKRETSTRVVTPSSEYVIPWDRELFDLEIALKPGRTGKSALDVVGRRIEYDVAAKTISLDGIKAPLELQDGRLTLRIVVDRTSIELFAQDGEVQIAKCFLPKSNVIYRGFLLTAEGDDTTLEKATTWELRSIWKR